MDDAKPCLERRPQVLARTGLSTAQLYALMAGNGPNAFPRPVRIGAKAVAWQSEKVDAWIRSRVPAAGAGGVV